MSTPTLSTPQTVRSPHEYAKQLGRGFLMGAADIVPGVSGGTVALVLGIYDRLVHNVRTGATGLRQLITGDVSGFTVTLRKIVPAAAWLDVGQTLNAFASTDEQPTLPGDRAAACRRRPQQAFAARLKLQARVPRLEQARPHIYVRAKSARLQLQSPLFSLCHVTRMLKPWPGKRSISQLSSSVCICARKL